MNVRFAIFMILCLPLVSGVAQERPVGRAPSRKPNPSSPALSASKRFVVFGLSTARNVQLGAGADEIADAVEQMVGRELPFARHEVIRVIVQNSEQLDGGRVIRAQGWADRQIVQKLRIINPDKADPEDVLEGFCYLLLNRYVITKQDLEARERFAGVVPEWLSVGMAQNLYPNLRARNGRLVVQAWLNNQTLSLAEILKLEYLPEGRWREKAMAGLAVSWILTHPNAPVFFDTVFRYAAEGKAVTLDLLADPDVLNRSPAQLEKEWDLWIAQQTKVKRALGGITPDRVEALQYLLVVSPSAMGFPEREDMPVRMTPDEMIDSWDTDWMPALATALSLKIRGLGIGEAPAFRAVLDDYGQFFDALSRCGSRSWFARLIGRGPRPGQLHRLLKKADAHYKEFLNELSAQPLNQVVGVSLGAEDEGMDRMMTSGERTAYREKTQASSSRE